jgi:hypothetical protein
LRERVTDIADRAAWLSDDTAGQFLRGRSAELLERLG